MNQEIRIIEYKINSDYLIGRIPSVLLLKKINWAKYRKSDVQQALMYSFGVNYAQVVMILKKAAQRKIVEYANGYLIVKRSESHA